MARSNDRVLTPLVSRVRRAWKHQSRFSLTTAIGSLYFAALAGAHLLAHDHGPVQAAPEVTVLLFGLAGMLVALIAGRRFPRWAGMALSFLLGGGIAAVLTSSDHPGTVVAALLVVPVLMVYLGFQPAGMARLAAAVVIAICAVAVFGGRIEPMHTSSGSWVVVYGGIVCWLVLEVSLALGEDLSRVVRTDPLTGALNRRGLNRYVRETRRSGAERWILVADIDGLKPLNDQHGHAAGDALLRATVASWQEVLGPNDVVGRWGGDEFVIIFRASGEAAAREVEARLREAAAQPFSAGLVRLQYGPGLDMLVRLADDDLYREKRERPPRADTITAPVITGDTVDESVQAWPALVSIGAAALYVASAAVGLMSAMTVWQVVAETAAVAVGVAAIFVAVRLGARYPHWGVLVWAGVMAVTLMVRAGVRDDADGLIELLFCLPLFAVISGWFYRRRVGRSFLAAIILGVLATVAFLPAEVAEAVGSMPLVAAIATAWLLLEAVHAVRHGERTLAETDPLTHALNRLGLDRAFERAAERTRRRGLPLAYVAVDFDGFKQINDEQGHDAGDRLLQSAVEAWRDALRADDVIGRVGGDEFVILLPGASAAAAEATMTRLHAEAGGGWSWGVAELRDGDDAASVGARADAVLYAAKAARN